MGKIIKELNNQNIKLNITAVYNANQTLRILKLINLSKDYFFNLFNGTLMATYEGSCFCGEVKVEVDGEPDAMVVCHCTVCRTWSASPVNGATIFKPENVRIVQGKDKLKSFAKNPGHDRSWCESCGGHVLTDHTNSYGFFDVYSSILKDLEFKPTAHFNYENTILPMKDGLPKFKDFP